MMVSDLIRLKVAAWEFIKRAVEVLITLKGIYEMFAFFATIKKDIQDLKTKFETIEAKVETFFAQKATVVETKDAVITTTATGSVVETGNTTVSTQPIADTAAAPKTE